MTDLTFDHLYPYAELTDALHGARRPRIPSCMDARDRSGSRTKAATSGSPRSRTTATGPHDEKPALFVEANIHATEITASTAALHLVHHLVTRYGTTTRSPARSTPRTLLRRPPAQPRRRRDGARRLADVPAVQHPHLPAARPAAGAGRAGHRRRRPRPHDARPRPERLVEGASRRRRACSFPARSTRTGPGDYYRLLPEGTIHEYDGVLDPDRARAPQPRPQPQLPAGVAARRDRSRARVRSRRPSPRCARSSRRSSRGRTSARTSRTTRSAA